MSMSIRQMLDAVGIPYVDDGACDELDYELILHDNSNPGTGFSIKGMICDHGDKQIVVANIPIGEDDEKI